MPEKLTEVSAAQMVIFKDGRQLWPISAWSGLARKDDPITSKDAAEKSCEFRARHEALIYDALHNAGERGLTSKEMARVVALSDVQISRRLAGMSTPERKLIEVTGDVRIGCRAWRVTA